ncbi:transcription factor TGA7 isoform X1 [Morus notabilis]|uniref:transcription factor TGA7 isoform X1 n=1 Tax=Morus notabilis TaxID=981085 RepID=UPI000CED2BDA|nr:transcription factor TGA7 isoform X1 [Morus notabilis]
MVLAFDRNGYSNPISQREMQTTKRRFISESEHVVRAQFTTSRPMGIYEPFRQVPMWKNTFENDHILFASTSTIVDVEPNQENKVDVISRASTAPPSSNEQEGNKPLDDKVQRRLAQNREAARKSRLRKKQLETSRLKLAQIEQELDRARKQGVYLGSTSLSSSHIGNFGTLNSGITTFEMEYGYWVEEQHRQNSELRNALQARVTDVELSMLVESGLNHYYNLFRLKEDAAKSDIFYLMSGIWRTSAERFFLWIGGFRPSELLNVVMPHIEPLSDQQVAKVNTLRQSSQQAEDALTQGIDKLHQTLALSMASDPMSEGGYDCQMASAVEKLEALESFVNQADHLRQQTMRHMSRILTTHQAARALLALGEFFHRLQALSSLWAARPCEPA